MRVHRLAKVALEEDSASAFERRRFHDAYMRAHGACVFWTNVAPTLVLQPPAPEAIIEQFQLVVSVYGARNMRNIQSYVCCLCCVSHVLQQSALF